MLGYLVELGFFGQELVKEPSVQRIDFLERPKKKAERIRVDGERILLVYGESDGLFDELYVVNRWDERQGQNTLLEQLTEELAGNLLEARRGELIEEIEGDPRSGYKFLCQFDYAALRVEVRPTSIAIKALLLSGATEGEYLNLDQINELVTLVRRSQDSHHNKYGLDLFRRVGA